MERSSSGRPCCLPSVWRRMSPVWDKASQVGFRGLRAPLEVLWLIWSHRLDSGHWPRMWREWWNRNPRAVTERCVVWGRVSTKQACVQKPSGRVSQGGLPSQTWAETGSAGRLHSAHCHRPGWDRERWSWKHSVSINRLHGIYAKKHRTFY